MARAHSNQKNTSGAELLFGPKVGGKFVSYPKRDIEVRCNRAEPSFKMFKLSSTQLKNPGLKLDMNLKICSSSARKRKEKKAHKLLKIKSN